MDDGDWIETSVLISPLFLDPLLKSLESQPYILKPTSMAGLVGAGHDSTGLSWAPAATILLGKTPDSISNPRAPVAGVARCQRGAPLITARMLYPHTDCQALNV